MRDIVFVTAPDARYGFNLAGVRQLVPSADMLLSTLDELMNDATTGVLILDERLVDARVQERVTEAERLWSGLVVVLPSPEKAARPAEDYAMRLVRQAIGYQVKVNL